MPSPPGWARSSRVRRLAPPIALAVAGALVAGVVVLHGRTQSSTQSSSTSATPAVVARVGGEDVAGQLFDIRYRLTITLITQQGGGPPQGSSQRAAFERQVRDQVMKGLIIDSVIAQEAGFRHVAAGDADVDAGVRQREGDAGGRDRLETQLAEAGGSIDQLRDEIRSDLNEQRLEELFARDRAAQVLQQLAAGAPFAQLAQTYSDDEASRAKGGDLGPLTAAQLAADGPELAAAVSSLGPGQRLAQPLRDNAGYEILEVGAVTDTTRQVGRILVAAPRPYTVKERPAWFLQAILAAIDQDCQANRLQVFIDIGEAPCSAPSPGASSPPAAPPSPAAGGSPPGR